MGREGEDTSRTIAHTNSRGWGGGWGRRRMRAHERTLWGGTGRHAHTPSVREAQRTCTACMGERGSGPVHVPGRGDLLQTQDGRLHVLQHPPMRLHLPHGAGEVRLHRAQQLHQLRQGVQRRACSRGHARRTRTRALSPARLPREGSPGRTQACTRSPHHYRGGGAAGAPDGTPHIPHRCERASVQAGSATATASSEQHKGQPSETHRPLRPSGRSWWRSTVARS
jgi:hypothetical protein